MINFTPCIKKIQFKELYRDGIPEPIDFIYFFTISSFVLCTEKKNGKPYFKMF